MKTRWRCLWVKESIFKMNISVFVSYKDSDKKYNISTKIIYNSVIFKINTDNNYDKKKRLGNVSFIRSTKDKPSEQIRYKKCNLKQIYILFEKEHSIIYK